jgi:hypothetical protein
MGELLYDVDSPLIAAVLLVAMLAAVEGGHRLGRRLDPARGAAQKEHIVGIQGATLGILALLLGFTFSLALQRFDGRSEAVVAEANAIGTAALRAQLLPTAPREETQALLRRYVDLRVAAGHLSMADHAAREALLAQAVRLQADLWDQAKRALDRDPAAHAGALFAASVNELIDSFGRRDAALRRHVPEVVLLLLFATFLMAGATVGYAAGVAGHRPSAASHLLVVLIVVLVFIVLDLDRPRRGLIQVSQKSLVDLRAGLPAAASAPTR